MKGCLMYVVIGFFGLYLFLLAIIGVPMLVLEFPVESGMVGGCITAAGMAFTVTFTKIGKSNDFGDMVGKYEDYTDEPMKFDEL